VLSIFSEFCESDKFKWAVKEACKELFYNDELIKITLECIK
jgi:hypothetical protein